MRRLADALHVTCAALYYHFKNRDEILVGVTQLALAEARSPRSESDHWRTWLPMNAYRARQALVAHPELIPIMLRRTSLGVGAYEVGASILRLEKEGVPVEAIAPLMDSLELLAIVSALQEVGGPITQEGPDTPESIAYERARRARGLSSDEVFDVLCSSVISTIETAISLKMAKAMLKSAPDGSATKGRARFAPQGTARGAAAVSTSH
jgi:AcrR family transcriptional regulator